MSSASADQRAAAAQQQQPPSSRATATKFAREVFYAMHYSTIHMDMFFPLPLARLTGLPSFSSSSKSETAKLQQQVETVVFGSWQYMLKYGLVTKDEIVTAVMEKTLKDLFTSKVRQFASDDPCVGSPRWRSVTYCKTLEQRPELIASLRFDTDYDNNIDISSRAEWKEVAGRATAGAEEYAQYEKRFKANILDDMTELKDEGNKLFGQGKFKEAVEQYKEAIACLVPDVRMGPFPVSQYNFVSVFYANCAQCFLNLKQFKEAAQNAKIALAFNPNNEKAKFRLQAATTGLLAPLSSSSSSSSSNSIFDNKLVLFYGDFADEQRYAPALSAAGFRPKVCTGNSDSFVRALAQETNKPVAAILFGSTDYPPPSMLKAAAKYRAEGGLVVLAADFQGEGHPDCPEGALKVICPSIKWGKSGYSRLTPSANTGVANPPLPPGCPKQMCVKSVWLEDVPAEETWYVTKTAQAMQSLVFRDEVSAGQVGAAFHKPEKKGDGALLYVGDVNWEPESCAVVISTIKEWVKGTYAFKDDNSGSAAGERGGGAPAAQASAEKPAESAKAEGDD